MSSKMFAFPAKHHGRLYSLIFVADREYFVDLLIRRSLKAIYWKEKTYPKHINPHYWIAKNICAIVSKN